MKSETKQQRMLRHEAEEKEREQRAIEFRKEMPERLLKIEQKAKELSIHTTVSLSGRGPILYLSKDYDSEYGFDDKVTYDTEEWEVEHIERKLLDLEEENNSKIARRALAEAVWETLTDLQRAALKENIRILK